MLSVLIGTAAYSQDRYLEEVFSNSEITVTKNITYGFNVNPLLNTSLMDPAYVLANAAQITAEKDSLLTMLATNPATIPLSFYYPYSVDTTTLLKITQVKMDVYMPDTAVDSETSRPVVMMVHTGSFLPPVINGTYGGSKEDSAIVEISKRLARRGFVVMVPNYRLGWNPLAVGSAGLAARRATLLNAVYRAIHDLQYAVKGARYAATMGSNPYEIDPTKIAMYGNGSGGYVALAYNTLDNQAETAIDKFVFGGNSVIQPAIVGDVNGNGGLLNLYVDNTMDKSVSVCINAGGALADISWLEAGDGPFISFHSPFDNFAPFDTGTVIVPTTGDDVVDVNGPNTFIRKANELGLNDVFAGFNDIDDYTTKARSYYGASISNSPLINVNDPIEIAAEDMEGLYTFVVRDPNGDIEPNGSPWEWWSKTDLDALVAATNTQTGGSYSSNDIHDNNLLTNPNMAKSKATLYIDTIIGYMIPRAVKTMQIGNWESVNVNELYMDQHDVVLFPNPASNLVSFKSSNPVKNINAVQIFDISGRDVYSNQSVNANQLTVESMHLGAGIYVGKVTLENGDVVLRKFMIE